MSETVRELCQAEGCGLEWDTFNHIPDADCWAARYRQARAELEAVKAHLIEARSSRNGLEDQIKAMGHKAQDAEKIWGELSISLNKALKEKYEAESQSAELKRALDLAKVVEREDGTWLQLPSWTKVAETNIARKAFREFEAKRQAALASIQAQGGDRGR